jgi:PTS system nitrogen regulatory IIA component
MGLKDALNTDLIRIDSASRDKISLLRAVADLAAGYFSAQGLDAESIFRALDERESLGSTGFGNGVAIPHCRLPAIDQFLVGVLVTTRGIDFNSVDGENSRIFPFVIGPESKPKEHLRLLSAISQILRNAGFRKQLCAANTDQQLRELLQGAVLPEDILPVRRPGSKLIHVFVQNEKIFDEILQIFSAIEDTSAMVVEAHESTDYLSKTPLFAGFWNTDVHQFNRIIMAVVRDELANGTIRNIEYVCGKLSERDDVMVTITDLHYVLGSLGS